MQIVHSLEKKIPLTFLLAKNKFSVSTCEYNLLKSSLFFLHMLPVSSLSWFFFFLTIHLSATHCYLIWSPYTSGLFLNEWYSLYSVLMLDKNNNFLLFYDSTGMKGFKKNQPV